MNKDFIARLQALRDEWGKPMLISSGTRCPTWNAIIHGAPQSQHLLGKASDIVFPDARDIPKFVALAEKHGFGGIGTGLTFVHLDGRDGHARWTY